MNGAGVRWPVWLRGLWGWVAAVAGLYGLVYGLWTLTAWGTMPLRGWVANLAVLPIDGLGFWAAFRAARDGALPAGLRRAWWFIALALAANALGDLTYFVLDNLLHFTSEQLALGPADIAYLAFYPLLLAGVLQLPTAPVQGLARAKFWLELGIGLTAAWMGVWPFVIQPLAQQAGAGFLGQVVAAAYPIGDLVLLAGLLGLLLRRPDPATRTTLALIAVALFSLILADLAYAALVTTRAFFAGGWADLGWFVASFFFFLAARRQRHYSAEPAPEHFWERWVEQAGPALPLLAILFGYGLLIVVERTEFAADAIFWGAALLTVLIVARQALDQVENRRLNGALRAVSQALEDRVAERTQQLHQVQEELLAAQKLAIVGTLAAEIVHEVSNPLNNIVNAAESLEGDLIEQGRVDDEMLQAYLPIMSRSAWQATRILQSLRSFSRGQAPELAPQNLAGLVQDTLILLGPRLQKAGRYRLEVAVPADLPRVVCDRNQIAQVLINLINNARDAMPAGGVIHLRGWAEAGQVYLAVADQGAGLTPEQHARVFEAFYTTKPIGQGSGLGLSIVERILRAHHGTICAESAGPGQGATFTLSLPAE